MIGSQVESLTILHIHLVYLCLLASTEAVVYHQCDIIYSTKLANPQPSTGPQRAGLKFTAQEAKLGNSQVWLC